MTIAEDKHHGQKLRELRQAHGMKIEDLARRSGVSHSYLGKLELQRDCNPSVKAAAAIAKGLDMGLCDLLVHLGYTVEAPKSVSPVLSALLGDIPHPDQTRLASLLRSAWEIFSEAKGGAEQAVLPELREMESNLSSQEQIALARLLMSIGTALPDLLAIFGDLSEKGQAQAVKWLRSAKDSGLLEKG